MLCPEVSNFSPFHIQTKTVQGSGTLNKFVTNIKLALPNLLHTPTSIKTPLTHDSEYYLVTDLPLAVLVSQEFIKAFVGNGTLQLVSQSNAHSDHSVLIENENMFITVPRHSNLNIVGQRISDVKSNDVTVKINLLKDKVPENLRDRLKAFQTAPFYVSWVPSDNTVCPSSLAKYFCNMGAEVVEKPVEIEHTRLKDIVSPDIEDFDDVENWIGAGFLGVPIEHSSTNTFEQSLLLNVDGLFDPARVGRIVEDLKAICAEQQLPWVVAILQSPEVYPLKMNATKWRITESLYTTVIAFKDGRVSARQKYR